MNFAFFGTGTFAVGVLEALAEHGYVPTLIVTAPDAPAGRGKQLTPPPVKTWAREHDVDVMQPDTLDAEIIGELGNTEWDAFIVADYGALLPGELIEIPQHGTLNVHPSLLPKLRGASPIQSAILTDARDAVGITIIRMDEQMDHGPIVAQARVELSDWPIRADTLRDMLATEGGNLVADVLPAWARGEITPEPQDHDAATFSRKIAKADGELDLDDDPHVNLRKVRALTPSPAAYFFADFGNEQVRVKVLDAEIDEDGTFVPSVVVPAGKKEMSYEDFRRGCRSTSE